MCELAPISTAPIRPGEYFGPCLLFGRTLGYGDERYAAGGWDGEDWIVFGVIFEPTHYVLLPRRPEEPVDPLKLIVDDISNYAHARLRGFIGEELPTTSPELRP